MDAIERLLFSVELPKMARIRQTFDDTRLDDVPAAVRQALAGCPAYQRIQPGARLAVTVGSRGIASLGAIVRAIVDALKERGAEPFIVPAMGSHGGATAEGQLSLVNELGERVLENPLAARDVVSRAEWAQLRAGHEVFLDARTSPGEPRKAPPRSEAIRPN